MVTFLESGVIQYFNPLFVFLFVLVAVYAILNMIKIFGENNTINLFIAVILAILFASSRRTTKAFEFATPWIVLLFLVLLFINIIFKFLGSEKTFLYPEGNPALISILAIVIIMIFILSLGEANRELKEEQAGVKEVKENKVLTFPQKVGETLRHPAVLGLIAVLLIAVFTVMLLAAIPKK